jgi:hypothetical protein
MLAATLCGSCDDHFLVALPFMLLLTHGCVAPPQACTTRIWRVTATPASRSASATVQVASSHGWCARGRTHLRTTVSSRRSNSSRDAQQGSCSSNSSSHHRAAQQGSSCSRSELLVQLQCSRHNSRQASAHAYCVIICRPRGRHHLARPSAMAASKLQVSSVVQAPGPAPTQGQAAGASGSDDSACMCICTGGPAQLHVHMHRGACMQAGSPDRRM